jgi:hypothetical protein
LRIELVDSGDLKAVGKALKQQADGKELRKQLAKELRSEIRPMVQAVKAAWLAAPSRGHATSSRSRRSEPNLRTLLAKATAGQVRFTGKEAGVRVRTDGRKLPDGMKALGGYAEGIRRRGWRHPVFGDTETWVQQRAFPRFYRTVQPDESRARQACIDAVDTVFDKIARAR